MIVIGPVVLSSKTRLYVSGFVIVTETRFGSHSPISRLHLCDSSSSIPFSCSSVPILDWLRTEAKASVGLAGGAHLRASPAAHHWRRGHGVGALLVASLGVEVEGAARGQRFTGDVKEGRSPSCAL